MHPPFMPVCLGGICNLLIRKDKRKDATLLKVNYTNTPLSPRCKSTNISRENKLVCDGKNNCHLSRQIFFICLLTQCTQCLRNYFLHGYCKPRTNGFLKKQSKNYPDLALKARNAFYQYCHTTSLLDTHPQGTKENGTC